MKNWSLSKKIWAILGLLTVAFVVSSYFSLSSLVNVKDSLNEVTGSVVVRRQLAADMRGNQRMISIIVAENLMFSDPESNKKYDAELKEIMEKQIKDMAAYESLASDVGKAILNKYRASYKNFIDANARALEFAHQQKIQEAKEAYQISRNTFVLEMRASLGELNDLTGGQLKDRTAKANSEAQQAIVTGLLISVTSILISMLVAFFVLRAVTRSIADVVKNLYDSSAQVSTAAGQIASSSEELSQSATEQAASLEETAASIEEMNSMVGKNSENANSTASTSNKSQEKATQGKAVVEKMIQSMGEINQSNNTIMEQVNRSNESIAGIVKVIEEIGNKTKVINDIVFQTKLLSFNASVEAARAGEHGKGFAVVAEEVGNLAQMSGNAAKEISTLLDESIHKVNEIVQETKTGVEKLIAEGKETVEGGAQVARECGEVLEEIVHNVSSVSSMAEEIASASQEQSRGVGEITKAMTQLDQMTQQNAATSEECASAAEELSAQAEALKNAVTLLVMTVNGSDGNTQAGPTVAPTASASSTPRKASATASPKNVVHLKTAKTSPSAAPQKFKKAAGAEAPAYHDEGFEDV